MSNGHSPPVVDVASKSAARNRVPGGAGVRRAAKNLLHVGLNAGTVIADAILIYKILALSLRYVEGGMVFAATALAGAPCKNFWPLAGFTAESHPNCTHYFRLANW